MVQEFDSAGSRKRTIKETTMPNSHVKDDVRSQEHPPAAGNPFVSAAVRGYREGGLRGALGHAVFALIAPHALRRRHVAGMRYDLECNVQTNEILDYPDDMVVKGSLAEGEFYEAAPIEVFRCALPRLNVDLSEFVFIDLGSGKGRAVLLASEFPFKRAIGVEFAEDIHSLAVRNFARFKSDRQKCYTLESHCADAGEYSYPDDKLVVFIFNAFKKSLLKRVLDNLEASYRKNPRKIFLVFLHPSKRNEVMSVLATLQDLKSRPIFNGDIDRLLYYRNTPYKLVIYETHPE